MANDHYCFLVLEESLPEGPMVEYRKSRRPKAKRPVATKRPRLHPDQAVVQTSARSRRSA
jgi:hypothetical protein